MAGRERIRHSLGEQFAWGDENRDEVVDKDVARSALGGERDRGCAVNARRFARTRARIRVEEDEKVCTAHSEPDPLGMEARVSLSPARVRHHEPRLGKSLHHLGLIPFVSRRGDALGCRGGAHGVWAHRPRRRRRRRRAAARTECSRQQHAPGERALFPQLRRAPWLIQFTIVWICRAVSGVDASGMRTFAKRRVESPDSMRAIHELSDAM